MNMILRALMVSVWFMALTFPLVVLKVDALNDTILFRWENMASIGVGAFVLSIFWRWSMERKARGAVSTGPSLFARALEAVRQPKPRYTCLGLIAVLMLVMPYISSMYQINIMISALIYIMLGLGLNIVVGLAGQLVLGYAAFYAVGAYTYGLLNTYFGLGFWAVLPVGGIMAALFGLMLGFPVLRLKGDYLAIVTLGFGEIIRLVLENWTSQRFLRPVQPQPPLPVRHGNGRNRSDKLHLLHRPRRRGRHHHRRGAPQKLPHRPCPSGSA